jgi:hypothetical protein
MLQTEFEFTLPKGYLDSEGNVHRKGLIRLAKAIDEIAPMKDPRVKSNPAYATVIILARVVTRLGEELFAADLNYLHKLYKEINELEDFSQPHTQRSEAKQNLPTLSNE